MSGHAFNLNRRAVLAAILSSSALLMSRLHAQETERVLRVSAPYNPSSLDPATGGAGSDHVILYPMFDTLVGFDPETLEARPSLAESWSYPDAQTFILNLRQGVTFHDGEKLDAEAVKFNLERVMSDARSLIKTELGTVANIEKTGEYQVTLHLKQPDSALPLIFADRAGMMFSPKALATLGSHSNRNPVGTGPLKFVSWTDNDSIKMVRNPNYWQKDLPRFDALEFKIITDVITGVRSVVSGQNNFIYQLRPAQKQALAGNKDISVIVAPTLYSVVMYMNYGRPPLDDRRVRLALNLAIDREAMNKALMLGLGQPAHTVLPSSHWACNQSATAYYKYDPSKAIALLADAGFNDGIDLEFSGYSDQRSMQMQEVIVAMLKQCAIRVKFTTGALATVTTEFFSNKKGDGTLAAWTGRPDPSVSFALMFNKESFLNAGKAEISPELTAAILESRRSSDKAARKAALDRVQLLVAENALYIPLVFQPEIAAYTSKVKGYKSNLLGKPRFDDVAVTT